MKQLVAYLLFLAVGFSARSQVAKDTIFFKNGTLVIGELKKVKLGVLTFDPDDANDITVQLRKIKTVIASSSVFRVEVGSPGTELEFAL